MATRPVFVPINNYPFVQEKNIEFQWYPGFAKTQAQKSIASLHEAAAKQGVMPLLEISSKSTDSGGVDLSAFNLSLKVSNQPKMSVECAFQGSKVFENGGPYIDLYHVSSREAKTDERLRTSGKVVGFNFCGEDFPTQPMTAFYDWLYIYALSQNSDLATKLLAFGGFTDIAFNPEKSINCQARSAALYVAFSELGVIGQVLEDKEFYFHLIREGK